MIYEFCYTTANMSSKVETLLQSLTLEEKISLLAGKDFWETVPIPQKGVPAIKVWILGVIVDMFLT